MVDRPLTDKNEVPPESLHEFPARNSLGDEVNLLQYAAIVPPPVNKRRCSK